VSARFPFSVVRPLITKIRPSAEAAQAANAAPPGMGLHVRQPPCCEDIGKAGRREDAVEREAISSCCFPSLRQPPDAAEKNMARVANEL
jgi:hypothetical protein